MVPDRRSTRVPTRIRLALLAAALGLAGPARAQLAPGDVVILSTFSGDTKLIRIDHETGAASNYLVLSGLGITLPRSIAVAPGGQIYLCQEARVTRLETNLALTPIVDGSALIDDPTGCALAGGALYVLANDDSSVVKVDIATGDVTLVADQDAFADSAGASGLNPVSLLDLEHQDGVLYVTDTLNELVHRVQAGSGAVDAIDPGELVHRVAASPSRLFVSSASGDAIHTVSLPGLEVELFADDGGAQDLFNVVTDVEYDPASDSVWAIASETGAEIVQLDAAGDVLRTVPLASLEGGELPFDLEVVPAPEPDAAVSGLAALAGLAALRGRRRRAAASAPRA